MSDDGTSRAVLVLGVGAWGNRVLGHLDAARSGSDSPLLALSLDHAHRPHPDDSQWERFPLGLRRRFDEQPHVWLPSEVLARAPLPPGAPGDRAHARLLLVTAQRQLRGFLSLHVHRFASRMQERGIDALEVLICSSLSGTMGSGALLDLAYLIREQLPPECDGSVGALLAVPDDKAYLAEEQESWQARTYAALLELNHFSRSHALFSLHDHTGKERLAAGSAPFDWTFLLFPGADPEAPRSTAADAASWIKARGTGGRFLSRLGSPRPTDGTARPPPFDTLRAVRLYTPADSLPELTAILLARRAVVRWTRSCRIEDVDLEGQRLLKKLLSKVSRAMEHKASSAWLAEMNQRCEDLVHTVDEAVPLGGDVGQLVWREARVVERSMFSELDRGARVWGEAAVTVRARVQELRELLLEEARSLQARPADGYQLLASALTALRTLVSDREQLLQLRIQDASHSEAGSRLRAARAELRKQTHGSPGLLGRFRGASESRVFDAFSEWVRWVPRFATHENDRINAQIELDGLGELLTPVEDLLDEARQHGAALLTVLDHMQTQTTRAVLDGIGNDHVMFPGGLDNLLDSANHLCDELLARTPELDALPAEIASQESQRSEDIEESARRVLAWALPRCDTIRPHLWIDAVIHDAPLGSPSRAVLERAVDAWLEPSLDHHPGQSCDTLLAVGLPGPAVGGELDRWLTRQAADRGIEQVDTFALSSPSELLLFRLDLGFPLWRLGTRLQPLRTSYERLRFGDEPVTLHTRADVADWSDIERP